MRYPFPAHLTLEEIRHAIAERNEALGFRAFIEAEREGYIAFNYTFAPAEAFPAIDDGPNERAHAILRECRGLIASRSSGRILARRYHKFFNVNERPETLAHAVDWMHEHIVLEKLDGSMITPFRDDRGARVWGTRLGASPAAAPAAAYAATNAPLNALADACDREGRTPIFEWCSPQSRIILDYPDERMVLTAVRDIGSGAYTPYSDLLSLGDRFDVPAIGSIPTSVSDPQAFLSEAENLVGSEGYVVRFADGHMLKVKGAWYCQLHKMKEKLQFEKDAFALVLENRLDDAKAFMDASDRERIDRFGAELARRTEHTAARLKRSVAEARRTVGDDKKRFALEFVNVPGVTPLDRPLLFAIWDGRDPAAALTDLLRKNTTSSTRLDQVRYLLGGLSWEAYRDRSFDSDA